MNATIQECEATMARVRQRCGLRAGGVCRGTARTGLTRTGRWSGTVWLAASVGLLLGVLVTELVTICLGGR